MGRKGKKPFGRALTDAAGIPPELVSSLPLLSMTVRKSCSLKISKEFSSTRMLFFYSRQKPAFCGSKDSIFFLSITRRMR